MSLSDGKVAGSSPGGKGGGLLLQGQLSLILVSAASRVTILARRRSWSFILPNMQVAGYSEIHMHLMYVDSNKVTP